MCGYPIQDYDMSCLCCLHKIYVFDLYAKLPSESFVTYFCPHRWPGHGLSPAIFLLLSASQQQFTKAFDLPQQCNKAQPRLEQTIHTDQFSQDIHSKPVRSDLIFPVKFDTFGGSELTNHFITISLSGEAGDSSLWCVCLGSMQLKEYPFLKLAIKRQKLNVGLDACSYHS